MPHIFKAWGSRSSSPRALVCEATPARAPSPDHAEEGATEGTRARNEATSSKPTYWFPRLGNGF